MGAAERAACRRGWAQSHAATGGELLMPPEAGDPRELPPLEALERMWFCWHLDFTLLTPSVVRE